MDLKVPFVHGQFVGPQWPRQLPGLDKPFTSNFQLSQTVYWPWAKEHYLFIGLTRDDSMFSIALFSRRISFKLITWKIWATTIQSPSSGDSNWFLHCLNLHATKAGRENDTFKLEKQSKQLLKIDIFNVQGQGKQSHRSLVF